MCHILTYVENYIISQCCDIPHFLTFSPLLIRHIKHIGHCCFGRPVPRDICQIICQLSFQMSYHVRGITVAFYHATGYFTLTKHLISVSKSVGANKVSGVGGGGSC